MFGVCSLLPRNENKKNLICACQLVVRTLQPALGGLRTNERNLVAEMIEMRKVQTAFMAEKCRNRNEAVMCPKPQRQNIRHCVGEFADQNIAGQLSHIFAGKASPPFYSGSPPIRSSNPVTQDARFREQRGQASPTRDFCIESSEIDRMRSITTMA